MSFLNTSTDGTISLCCLNYVCIRLSHNYYILISSHVIQICSMPTQLIRQPTIGASKLWHFPPCLRQTFQLPSSGCKGKQPETAAEKSCFFICSIPGWTELAIGACMMISSPLKMQWKVSSNFITWLH